MVRCHVAFSYERSMFLCERRSYLHCTRDSLLHRKKREEGKRRKRKSQLFLLRYYDSRANLAEIDSAEISTMKLFYDKRMLNELRARGKEKGPLDVSDLVDIDQVQRTK